MHDTTTLVVLFSAKLSTEEEEKLSRRENAWNNTISCTITPNAWRQVQISVQRMAQISVLLRDQEEKYRDLLQERNHFV